MFFVIATVIAALQNTPHKRCQPVISCTFTHLCQIEQIVCLAYKLNMFLFIVF